MTRSTWIEAPVGDPAHAPRWRVLAAHGEHAAAGRTRVGLRHVGTDAGGIRTPADRTLSVDEGADAVIASCGCLGAVFASHGHGCGCLDGAFAAHGHVTVEGVPDAPVWAPNSLAAEHALSLLLRAEAGVGPTGRGCPRPVGERARALATARRLLDAPPSPERTPV